MKTPKEWYEEIEKTVSVLAFDNRLRPPEEIFVEFIRKIQGQAVIEAAAEVADIPEAPGRILKLLPKGDA